MHPANMSASGFGSRSRTKYEARVRNITNVGRDYTRKGWDVVEVYRLDATSGKTVKEYPETKRMLEHLSSERITGLIFSKFAHLARNTRELLEFAEIFRQCDADLISLAESIDTSTPAPSTP